MAEGFGTMVPHRTGFPLQPQPTWVEPTHADITSSRGLKVYCNFDLDERIWAGDGVVLGDTSSRLSFCHAKGRVLPSGLKGEKLQEEILCKNALAMTAVTERTVLGDSVLGGPKLTQDCPPGMPEGSPLRRVYIL